jgi:tetratricopeptide (TPR) repeat protein
VSRRRLAAIGTVLGIALGRGTAWAGADEAFANYLEAVSELQAIVDRSPGYSYGFFLLGHCELKMRAPTVAEGHFRRAIELEPGRSEYYQGLALALRDEADWVRTIQATTDGLKHSEDPRKRYAMLSLRGYAWGALQRWDQAAADLEVARRIHQEPWVFAVLGKAYFASGDPRKAIPPLLNALRAEPDDPAVLRVLGESYIRVAGDEPDMAKKRLEYANALEIAQHLVALVPDDLEAIHLVGRAALGAGRLEQAERVFNYVLSRDPHQCYAMVNLGRTYFAAERFMEAEASLLRAVACAPRMAVIYETLGDLYLKRGMGQEAAVAFRRAEELSPPDDGAHRPANSRPRDAPTIPVSLPP